MAKDYTPIFAVGNYDDIAPAIEDGTLSYPAFVVCTDQKIAAFVNKDLDVIELGATDSSIERVVGIPDEPITVSDLDDGVYYVTGYYRPTPEGGVYITASDVLFIVTSDYEAKYAMKIHGGDITRYTVNTETGDESESIYPSAVDETPTEGSANPVSSNGVYQAIIGAMKERY